MSLHLRFLMQLNLCQLIYVSRGNLRNKSKLKDGWPCPWLDPASGELVLPLVGELHPAPSPSTPHFLMHIVPWQWVLLLTSDLK